MALVYRVVRQKYADRPLDVAGTRLNGGRWNPPGVGILYTAEHPALALVEILVHMPQVPYEHLPSYRLFTLEIPENSQRMVKPEELLPYWNENTYARSQYLLQDWLTKPDTLALGVPSSVLPAGINYLLHASHPQFADIRIVAESDLVIDPRLRNG
ncbi:RES family NAD+ phosphorylase [Larkinella humicola]|uniref:RES family NAD+ phosphorylase n=1 Tax=Larkinella humicola TaxID=2607654 RepID=A0A5N1JDK0_9BACT|nr:RES family NAD+ phosphorylase [Larkinella humicola]KAA9353431.1 RES family NAD+ phosphorylase [Larkinella humicola]